MLALLYLIAAIVMLACVIFSIVMLVIFTDNEERGLMIAWIFWTICCSGIGIWNLIAYLSKVSNG